MDRNNERLNLRSKINELSIKIHSRQEIIKKMNRLSRIGRQERKCLKQEKKALKKALSHYQELMTNERKLKLTEKYFENPEEQRQQIQTLYNEFSVKEAELFQKINNNRPFLPDFIRQEDAANFTYEFDCEIGKSIIGSDQNKALKSLFHKVEPYIKDEITDPSILHLKKLSQNTPHFQPEREQKVPIIPRVPSRSMNMPSM